MLSKPWRIRCMRWTCQSSGVYCNFRVEMRRREMEAVERLLGMVVLMPWRRTDAVGLRRRGVWGSVRGILGRFGSSGPPNWGEGVRASGREKAPLEDGILNNQMNTWSHENLVADLWDAYEKTDTHKVGISVCWMDDGPWRPYEISDQQTGKKKS